MGSWNVNAYLFAYNVAQAFGWAVVLVRIVQDAVHRQTLEGAYAVSGSLVRGLQLAALLEVFHSAIGLVRSGLLTALLQWAGRAHVLFAIISRLHEVQGQPPVFITFAAWSLSEVIRYPQYGLTIIGYCPKWLTWLRYSAFIVLYPVGILYGEMLSMYLALDPIKGKNLYFKLFKWMPINYHKFIIVLMALYPALGILLYKHMFQQRRAKVGRKPAGRKSSRSKRYE